jgi:hypothetical protein
MIGYNCIGSELLKTKEPGIPIVIGTPALDFSCETISDQAIDQASPFNFFMAAVNLGTTSKASPTIP